MDGKLLEILACPVCKGPLVVDSDKEELICRAERLAFPVKEGIPVMLEKQARAVTLEELEHLK